MARLLFFGKLADIAGGRARDMALDPATQRLSQLTEAIEAREPALGAALKGPLVRFVVNEEIVSADAPIADDDEIAFLPPVSGG